MVIEGGNMASVVQQLKTMGVVVAAVAEVLL